MARRLLKKGDRIDLKVRFPLSGWKGRGAVTEDQYPEHGTVVFRKDGDPDNGCYDKCCAGSDEVALRRDQSPYKKVFGPCLVCKQDFPDHYKHVACRGGIICMGCINVVLDVFRVSPVNSDDVYYTPSVATVKDIISKSGGLHTICNVEMMATQFYACN